MDVTPYLYYEDVDAALDFLTEAFGMPRHGEESRGLDGKINHAAVAVGDSIVMIGRPAGGYRNPKRLGGATQSLYVHITGVDRHYRQAREAGATILEEPSDTAYGQRRYGATDPEGHQWYFAEDLPPRE